MSVCICTMVSVCIYTMVSVCICTMVSVCIYTMVSVCIYTMVSVCVYTMVSVCIYTCSLFFGLFPSAFFFFLPPSLQEHRTCVRALERGRWGRGGETYAHTHIRTRIHTHTHTYTHTNTHTHTHTHTHGMQVLLLKHRKHETFRLRFLSGHARVSLLSAYASLPLFVYLRACVTHTHTHTHNTPKRHLLNTDNKEMEVDLSPLHPKP